ncbi:MAG: hypothetical protein V7638_3152 [Acidobacteriota bacterium]
MERVCAVENFSGDDRGDGASEGDGDGEGETSTDGDGVAGGAPTASTVVTGVSVAAEAFGC